MRYVEVVPIATDRAVVWCKNEAGRISLLTEQTMFYRRNTIARMEPSSIYAHWDHVKIKARNSWIGIEGLPRNLWNIHAFKVIGEACRGLLEVAKEALDHSFLLFTKIKIRGLKEGLTPHVLEVCCQGERIHLGLFNLEISLNQSHRKNRGRVAKKY